jgi:putative addiction module component (TIGR02574 family)
MSTKLEECEVLALKLSPSERANLATHLIASLDALDEAENELLWIQEAERRYQAYKQGNLSAKPAEEVFREARAQKE